MFNTLKARVGEGSSLVAIAVVLGLLAQLFPDIARLHTVVLIAALACAVAGFLTADKAASDGS